MRSPDFSQAFKAAMDAKGLRPSVLAEATGRSRTNISEIRNGKSSPSIRDFAELLTTAESLVPGFIETWACNLVGAAVVPSVDEMRPTDFLRVEEMKPEEKAKLLNVIADSLVKGSSKRESKELVSVA